MNTFFPIFLHPFKRNLRLAGHLDSLIGIFKLLIQIELPFPQFLITIKDFTCTDRVTVTL